MMRAFYDAAETGPAECRAGKTLSLEEMNRTVLDEE